jgi:hypothetical protein
MPSAKDVFKMTMGLTDMVMNSYLGDLSDAELTIRPVEGMNPIAWQLGHLIMSERRMIETVKPGSSPELPAGFEEAHSKEALELEKPAYLSKSAYLDLMKKQREATLAVIAATADSDLDKETGISYAPTYAALFNMIGLHPMMHAGQFVAVRRMLKKPVTI